MANKEIPSVSEKTKKKNAFLQFIKESAFFRFLKDFFNKHGKLILEKIKLSLFYSLIIILWETVLHLLTFGWLRQESLYMLAFSVPVGCVLALIRSLFKNKAGRYASQVIMILLTLLYCSQYIYSCIFGSFFSVFQIGMGGDAITSFWKETISTIGESVPQLVLLSLPLVLYELFFFLYKKPVTTYKFKPAMVALAVTLALHGLCLLSLNVDGKNYYSFKDIYFSNSTSTDRSIEILGVVTTTRLEAQHMIFGTADNQLGIVDVEIPKAPGMGGADGQGTGTTDVETVVPTENLNIIPAIDFEYLKTLNSQNAVDTLNEYFAEQTASNKNEYTGLFKDYNLIVMCCESFHPALVSPEFTPTLYRLSHEGIIFNNFYNCYLNNTTNGEYTLCMGNFPDLSRSKSNGSFHNSRENYLPFCLGNMFNSIGVKSYGYHNYLGSYYDRESTHPNMGYECKFADAGMTFSTSWPASDLEMLEQSVDDYINNDRFHAYYMTFSGHYKYNFSINPMAARNQNKVYNLDYSDPVKAYLACNYEL
ncbi:MAG: sulfatase-like hydrolase/transferase, partial [Clostridia bacterium]|nr:sulfatase-like hydrolase/transferase [Clostridia bacterium]